ncbi:MAG: alkaline phosphatase [Acidobacteria bacterium]|nr:alkaline phosphatase [Acidobacteriota bacterium]
MHSFDSSRRDFLVLSAAALATVPAHGAESLTRQATGVKVGELTATSARIWARRTKASSRRAGGVLPTPGNKPAVLPLGYDVGQLDGACAGDEGQLRVIVRDSKGKTLHKSDWAEAKAASDFTYQFAVSGLEPATAYKFTVEARGEKKVEGKEGTTMRTDGALHGAFRTAPPEDALTAIDIAMLSCQKYSERDSRERGFQIYDAIAKWAPHCLLSVGDNVYYDSDDPKVNSVAVARHHWHRMYSQPSIVDCLRKVPGYWLKDDHDCYSDDCWPGYVDEKMKPFTFEQGLGIFPEQAPLGALPYRRFKWGRSIEMFMLEGRDYRTGNKEPDGATKSLWGAQQKAWLLDGLNKSDAQWKLIVSPGPLVGPDRKNKHDNHSNDAFETEGREFRKWLAQNSRITDTVWVNGDRHWQYHSVDPETKVNEFCCGAATDSHASGTPGEDPTRHRFHRVKGGFLAIRVRVNGSKSELVLEHRDVLGNRVYGHTFA